MVQSAALVRVDFGCTLVMLISMKKNKNKNKSSNNSSVLTSAHHRDDGTTELLFGQDVNVVIDTTDFANIKNHKWSLCEETFE
jgi:hypothetical protein